MGRDDGGGGTSSAGGEGGIRYILKGVRANARVHAKSEGERKRDQMSTPPPTPPELPFPSPSPTLRPLACPPPPLGPTIIGLAGSSCFLIGSPGAANQSARFTPPAPPRIVDVGEPARVGVSSMSTVSAALEPYRSEDDTERFRPAAGRSVDVDEGEERVGTGGGGFGSTKRDVRRDESEGEDRLADSVRWVLGERRLFGLGFESEVEREIVLDPVRRAWFVLVL